MKFPGRKICIGISLSVLIITMMMMLMPIDVCSINDQDPSFLKERNVEDFMGTNLHLNSAGLSIGNEITIRL